MFAESRVRVLILPPITFLHILLILSYTFSYYFLTHSPITFLHILLLLSYTFSYYFLTHSPIIHTMLIFTVKKVIQTVQEILEV